jgi:hypothetical protein
VVVVTRVDTSERWRDQWRAAKRKLLILLFCLMMGLCLSKRGVEKLHCLMMGLCLSKRGAEKLHCTSLHCIAGNITTSPTIFCSQCPSPAGKERGKGKMFRHRRVFHTQYNSTTLCEPGLAKATIRLILTCTRGLKTTRKAVRPSSMILAKLQASARSKQCVIRTGLKLSDL